MRRLFSLTIATVLLVFVVSANAQNIPAEDDTWVTGNGTQVDFSNFGNVNLTNVLGAQPDNSVVSFVGVQLSSSLGQADTLVRREAFTVPALNNTVSPGLSIKGLSLASSPDVTVGSGARTYHVTVSLATQSDTGYINLTTTTSEGGTFHSHFDVTPVFVFTNVQYPYDSHTVDCSDTSLGCKFPMGGDGNWVKTSSTGFDPQSMGIPIVPSGVQIGSYTTTGRTRFGGVQVGCGGTHSSGYGCGQNNEMHGEGSIGQQIHGTKPPTDCASSSSSSARTSARTGGTTSGTAATQSTGTGATPVLCTATVSPTISTN